MKKTLVPLFTIAMIASAFCETGKTATTAAPDPLKTCGKAESDYCRFFVEKDCTNCQIPGIQAHGYQAPEDKNLSKANLAGADLGEAKLEYAILTNANLSKADLRGTNLRYANLNGANLDGALVDQYTRIGHIIGTVKGKPAKQTLKELRPVAKVKKPKAVVVGQTQACDKVESDYCRFFTEKDCTKCQVPGIQAHGYRAPEDKNLDQANLAGADLSNATLEYAILSNANLTKADLRGANLRYANLNGANLDGALVDQYTRIGHIIGTVKGKPAKQTLKELRPVAKVKKPKTTKMIVTKPAKVLTKPATAPTEAVKG